MQKALACLLIVMVTGVTVQATTYSCRDRQGRLHITDNQQALPAECRGRMQQVGVEDPDNLNFVPAQAEAQGAGDQFQQAVSDVEREQQQKHEQVKQFLLRAERLAVQYRQAVQEKNNATRRWSYSSREIIQKADDKIQKTHEGKEKLLIEVSEVNIPRKDEAQIVSWLGEITD